MLIVRPAAERGHVRSSWLDTYHSFSFGEYHDSRYLGVSNLRVINEDTIAPGQGFATHGHNDMEIVTVVLEGELAHRDSLGNGAVIRPGDIQHMSAGTGVRHSEFNPSSDVPVHLLQIWLEPNVLGVAPAYAQQHFPLEARRGRLVLLVSPDGRDGSLATHQDACLSGTRLDAGQSVTHTLASGRPAYVQVARGHATVNGHPLTAGDGAHLLDELSLQIEGLDDAELLVFDLP
jgi:quercetin 2,3-dioxygenase